MNAISRWWKLAAALVAFAGCADHGLSAPAAQRSDLRDEESDDDSNVVRVPGARTMLAANETGSGAP